MGIFGTRRRPQSAFTLVELLVVVSILAILIAILVPGLRGARKVSKRVVCGTRLRVVGQALQMYLIDSNDYLPIVESMPSIPLFEDNPRPSIADVLQPYVQKYVEAPPEEGEETEDIEIEGNEAFHCPADTAGKTRRSGDNMGKSFFQSEGSSYEFNVRLHMFKADASLTGGIFDTPVKLSEIVRTDRAKHFFGSQPAEEEVWLMKDYLGFHGKPGTPFAANYLYVDGRVTDLTR